MAWEHTETSDFGAGAVDVWTIGDVTQFIDVEYRDECGGYACNVEDDDGGVYQCLTADTREEILRLAREYRATHESVQHVKRGLSS